MSKRITRSIVALLLITTQISMAAIPVGKVFAAADTCTWTGAASSNWSDSGNWTSCDGEGVPEDGDALLFPKARVTRLPITT